MTISSLERHDRTRVGIIDHHPIVRHGIRNELTQHGDFTIVGEADNFQTAHEMVQSATVDVLILDIEMPDIYDIDLIRYIVESSHGSKVLVFTACNNVEAVLFTLRSGVAGYVLKSEEPATLPKAIRDVLCGKMWISAAIRTQLVDHTVRTDSDLPDVSTLSAREVEVLHELAQGKDNREIGWALSISERTVRFHLRNIYDKLHMRRSEVIIWAVHQGFGQSHDRGSVSLMVE